MRLPTSPPLVELNRYAVLRATARDIDGVLRCRDVCDQLFGQLMLFEWRNGNLRRKFDAVKYTVKKLEQARAPGWGRESLWHPVSASCPSPCPPLQIIYELTLATSTGGAVVPKGAPDEPGAPAGRDGEEGGAGGGGACACEGPPLCAINAHAAFVCVSVQAATTSSQEAAKEALDPRKEAVAGEAGAEESACGASDDVSITAGSAIRPLLDVSSGQSSVQWKVLGGSRTQNAN